MKYKCVFLLTLLVTFSLFSCKKNSQAPVDSKTAILGKWLITKHSYVLIQDGVQIGQSNDTTFAANDFIQYFNDGSGIASANTVNAFGVNQFTYTISGTSLVQINKGNNSSVHETITKLTTTNLSIHYQLEVQDPDNANETGTEIDDFDLKKAN